MTSKRKVLEELYFNAVSSYLRDNHINQYPPINVAGFWITKAEAELEKLEPRTMGEQQEAVFCYPNNGYEADQELAKKYLELNKSYAIDHIEQGDWHTDVWLKEFPKVKFNSVLFEIGKLPVKMMGDSHAKR